MKLRVFISFVLAVVREFYDRFRKIRCFALIVAVLFSLSNDDDVDKLAENIAVALKCQTSSKEAYKSVLKTLLFSAIHHLHRSTPFVRFQMSSVLKTTGVARLRSSCDLVTCFAAFTDPELLSGSNAYGCENCTKLAKPSSDPFLGLLFACSGGLSSSLVIFACSSIPLRISFSCP
jgi:NADH:ubiquinone oxidoreductase subunit 2 (subunit N)